MTSQTTTVTKLPAIKEDVGAMKLRIQEVFETFLFFQVLAI